MKKDLQAFEQLKELADGQTRPRVAWLGLEEKKNGGRESKGEISSKNSGSNNGINSKVSNSTRSYATSNRNTKASFLQETGKKDDRILETQTDGSLRNLSQARLRALLAAQQKLADGPLCKRLPDGGAKILKKIAQIQAALEFVIHVDALVMGLEINMSQLKLDEESEGKLELDVDASLRALVAKKVQQAQKARTPYSQASLAITMTPDGSFPGVNPKYRSGAPKFLTLAEAEELSRASRKAIELQQKEQSSAIVGSQGSAFRTAHWHRPDADFSSQQYREPGSDFDEDDENDDDDEEDQEQDDQEDDEDDENDDDHAFMHVRPSPMLV